MSSVCGSEMSNYRYISLLLDWQYFLQLNPEMLTRKASLFRQTAYCSPVGMLSFGAPGGVSIVSSHELYFPKQDERYL